MTKGASRIDLEGLGEFISLTEYTEYLVSLAVAEFLLAVAESFLNSIDLMIEVLVSNSSYIVALMFEKY